MKLNKLKKIKLVYFVLLTMLMTDALKIVVILRFRKTIWQDSKNQFC
jgi:hypothetical protein